MTSDELVICEEKHINLLVQTALASSLLNKSKNKLSNTIIKKRKDTHKRDGQNFRDLN
jgi:hypothetical protein